MYECLRLLRKMCLVEVLRRYANHGHLRPGTLPVHLVAGLGTAATTAARNHLEREKYCLTMKREALEAFAPLNTTMNGDVERTMAHTLNIAIERIDSEAVMVATKHLVAISNGSACTSQKYEPSHVLVAMNVEASAAAGALRISWCHLTPHVNWSPVIDRFRDLATSPVTPE
jgi:cysteine desulfurase